MTACAWALLDVVVACVCDATATVIDMVHQPLSTFLAAALRCAGANADASARVHANDQQSASIGDTPVARSGAAAGIGGGSHSPRHLPPCGLHPATLHRLLMTALTAHTFAHQKREYARVGWQWCLDMGVAKDAEVFYQRMLQARRGGWDVWKPPGALLTASSPTVSLQGRRQAAMHMRLLQAMVHGVVIALERGAWLLPCLTPFSLAPGVILPSHCQTLPWTAASRSPPSCSATTPPRPP